MPRTSATFEITLHDATTDLDGAADRYAFTKTWRGGIVGESHGAMLAGGDPTSGNAGYVAVEAVHATLDGRHGSWLFQQFGTLHDGAQALHYVVVPGSGSGELTGLTGTVTLEVVDGVHNVGFVYEVAGDA